MGEESRGTNGTNGTSGADEAKLKRAQRRVAVAMGAIVFLSVGAVLAMTSLLLPYSPITIHSYESAKPVLCPQEVTSVRIDYSLKGGAASVSRVTVEPKWEAVDVPGFEPGQRIESADAVTANYPTNPGRRTIESDVLRVARASRGSGASRPRCAPMGSPTSCLMCSPHAPEPGARDGPAHGRARMRRVGPRWGWPVSTLSLTATALFVLGLGILASLLGVMFRHAIPRAPVLFHGLLLLPMLIAALSCFALAYMFLGGTDELLGIEILTISAAFVVCQAITFWVLNAYAIFHYYRRKRQEGRSPGRERRRG